ncbi:PLP-dependent aminotransferase family protein [Porcipelethomonas sp.]|uniref:MocR-like pyridoxine biosynthesis transcription factor PdxR n=1 Tax=Porcipelethomonas sp. TaxID=2981675 RepID=UPI003EF3832A
MLTFNLDSKSKLPLYEQLYKYIRNELETGGIKAGEKLPSKRELASHLKISVVTVETAYAQLAAEGYISPKPGSGFYAEAVQYAQTPEIKNIYIPEKSPGKKYRYNFKTNMVDTKLFPFSTWAKLSREILSEQSPELLSACDPRGTYELRKEIALYLKSFRGIEVHPDQIIVGSGSEYLTGLIIQLLGRNLIYGIEDPGYTKIYKIFHGNCPDIRPISMDEDGADYNSVKRSGADAVHITPSHHFPLGSVMPVNRRIELLKWAYDSDGRYIIEDDYDSEFRFSGRPVPAMQSLDSRGRVIYINTFTKSLAPSMRISYMILPPELLEKFMKELGFYACTVPVFEQLTLAKFMERGHFERHIRRMKKLYRQRRDTMTEAINSCGLKNCIALSGLDSGLHVLMKVNNSMTESQLVTSAENEDVKVYGLSGYYSFSKKDVPESCIIAGYSGLNEEDITEGVARLEKAWLRN